MKRFATGALGVCAILFVVARIFEARYPGLGYLRAMAEAGMVGGIADWFAITALFRHPLGLPIPHTAIIPQRKDRIGRSLGSFVQTNFLAGEVIERRLSAVEPGARIALWLSDPQNAARISRHVSAGLVAASRAAGDGAVQSLIERTLADRIRAIQAAPLLGNLLAVVTADRRHQELLDEVLRLAARAASENEELIRRRVSEETPWWVPDLVDEKIHARIVSGIERTLSEVANDPEHSLRQRFDVALGSFIERLRHSPEAITRAEEIKQELLEHPALREFAASLWTDAREALARRLDDADPAEPDIIVQALTGLADAVLADPALLEKINLWITEVVVSVVGQYRHEVGHLIEQTVAQWDADATSNKIELQIGRDLQFVRINGTIVGGLVGLVLYTISRLF
ncbi:MAG: DUF445 domain-containing protein [Gemmatimonadota bacterium]|jgi:uncharacterized membrane-anchored protein YjiN (DUF445 family)|nr:DUF445 domain-containing protein [Gemmatimonadota bacterium]